MSMSKKNTNGTYGGKWDYSLQKFSLKTLTDISKDTDLVKNLDDIVVNIFVYNNNGFKYIIF